MRKEKTNHAYRFAALIDGSSASYKCLKTILSIHNQFPSDGRGQDEIVTVTVSSKEIDAEKIKTKVEKWF